MGGFEKWLCKNSTLGFYTKLNINVCMSWYKCYNLAHFSISIEEVTSWWMFKGCLENIFKIFLYDKKNPLILSFYVYHKICIQTFLKFVINNCTKGIY